MSTLTRRYGLGARWYDALSGEKLVYGAGRAAGVALLDPRPGEIVIDLGCGTGLNFAPLMDAVGPSGSIIAIDRSPDMLAMAARRIAANGWSRIRLIRADAAILDPALVRRVVREQTGRDRADALLSTYALSVIPEREDAWARAKEALRPGGRACIVDMQPPVGGWRVLSPLARLACAAGGSDIRSRPWRMLEGDAAGIVRRRSVRGGHIVALAANLD